MTYKQIVIDYLKDKNLILNTYSKEPYMIKADWKYIKSLSEEVCKDFLINTLCAFSDCTACPWCHINYKSCDNCDYTKNHGNCVDEDKSSYQKIKYHLSKHGYTEGIVSIPDIIDLITRTNKRVKRLQNKENKNEQTAN